MTSRRQRRPAAGAGVLDELAYSENNRYLATELAAKRGTVAVLASTITVLRRELIAARIGPAVFDACTQTSPPPSPAWSREGGQVPAERGQVSAIETEPARRPLSRATQAVFYAEPSLKTKLRRPGTP